jgi:hypothetical protein
VDCSRDLDSRGLTAIDHNGQSRQAPPIHCRASVVGAVPGADLVIAVLDANAGDGRVVADRSWTKV